MMIKTALSASLIALAILAPAASAADEVKPPRQTHQAAPTCRTPAAEVDSKAPPAPRLTKAELEALRKLPLCAAEEAQEPCPPHDKLQMAAEIAGRLSRSGSSTWPDWLMDFHRPDCGLDLVNGGSEPRNGGGAGPLSR